MELVILVGLQASRKTTFFRERFAATHWHVSKDHFPNNRRPGNRQRRLIEDAHTVGRSVVVDNTNPTAADRAELVALGRAFEAAVVCYYFLPDLTGSLARNETREGRTRVPDVGLYAVLKRLEPSTPAEGFDRVFEVLQVEGGGFEVGGVGGVADRGFRTRPFGSFHTPRSREGTER